MHRIDCCLARRLATGEYYSMSSAWTAPPSIQSKRCGTMKRWKLHCHFELNMTVPWDAYRPSIQRPSAFSGTRHCSSWVSARCRRQQSPPCRRTRWIEPQPLTVNRPEAKRRSISSSGTLSSTILTGARQPLRRASGQWPPTGSLCADWALPRVSLRRPAPSTVISLPGASPGGLSSRQEALRLLCCPWQQPNLSEHRAPIEFLWLKRQHSEYRGQQQQRKVPTNKHHD